MLSAMSAREEGIYWSELRRKGREGVLAEATR